jgi:hypothetical protein
MNRAAGGAGPYMYPQREPKHRVVSINALQKRSERKQHAHVTGLRLLKGKTRMLEQQLEALSKVVRHGEKRYTWNRVRQYGRLLAHSDIRTRLLGPPIVLSCAGVSQPGPQETLRCGPRRF